MRKAFNVSSMNRGRNRRPLDSNQVRFPGGKADVTKAFSRTQALFNENFSKYARENVVVTPGYLRLESGAFNTAATSQVQFQTLATSGTQTPTERRLKLADKFTVTGYCLYIGYGSATSYAPTAAQYSVQQLATFPNPQVAAFTGGSIASNHMAIYNGYTSLRIDTTTFIDSVPNYQFYRVGTSQQGVLGGTGGTAVQRDEWPLALYGRNEALPSIDLDGKSNIEWTVTLPAATDLRAASGSFTQLVLILTGFLNQGASGMK
jgi:hypothetical protein